MIEAQENEIELVVTYYCNWKCDYCCVDTHSKPFISPEDIDKKLEKVIPGYNVTLSGGEVGLLPVEQIEHIIEELEKKTCRISLNTNGYFLRKHAHLAKYFEYILYHCSEDLIKDPDYKSVEEFKRNNPEVVVDLMLVVTDNNIHRLAEWLDRNKDNVFHVVAATQPEDGMDVTLSNKNRYWIMKQQFPNISQESMKRLIIKEKDFDRIIYI